MVLSSTGDNRTRTCDPLHVKQMLSQLSYVSLSGIILPQNPHESTKTLIKIHCLHILEIMCILEKRANIRRSPAFGEYKEEYLWNK